MSIFRGKRVLVVEDEPVVAMLAEDILDELGAVVVGPAAHLEHALKLATSELLDFALLDVNLNGRMSRPVAEELTSRHVPFVFTTGYDNGSSLEFDAPVVQKPYSSKDITNALESLARAQDELSRQTQRARSNTTPASAGLPRAE